MLNKLCAYAIGFTLGWGCKKIEFKQTKIIKVLTYHSIVSCKLRFHGFPL